MNKRLITQVGELEGQVRDKEIQIKEMRKENLELRSDYY